MRIAVAGGRGFVGRSVVTALRTAGHQVRVLSRQRSGSDEGTADAWHQVDLARSEAACTAALAGCDAVVNLVGIKTARAQSFAAAHETVVDNLIAAATSLGIVRFIHISVADVRADTKAPYLASKSRGEQLVRASGLSWTIVRPGVIFGEGDDFVTNLARMLRHAPWFPLPDGGTALLQPVAVTDVAAAVVAALRGHNEHAVIDVVGPERLPMHAWVARIAAALELRAFAFSVPARWLWPAVAVLERVFVAPPLTTAQLGLLTRGVVGASDQTAALLGRPAQALSIAKITEISADVEAWLGLSLRLASAPGCGPKITAMPSHQILVIVVLAVALITSTGALSPNIWWRMLAASVVLLVASRWFTVPWRSLLRPKTRHLAIGTAAAVVVYVAGAITVALLRSYSPGLALQVAELTAWGGLLAPGLAVPTLLVVVTTEELFWRGGLTVVLRDHLGPWSACAVAAGAYALAHITVGPPILVLAAFGCGLVWSWLVMATGSLIPALVCHLLWDIAVLWLVPY